MKNYLVVILACLCVFPLHAQKPAMTTDDGMDMVGLSSAMLSPDGNSILYATSEQVWKTNKRKASWHYISPDSSLSYPYFGETATSSIQYSPDGKYLAMKRKGKEHQQLFLMHTRGGEPVKLSSHKTSVGAYKWAPDSKGIFFVSDQIKKDKEKKKLKDGYDHVIIDEGPNGQRKGSWEYIWYIDLATKKAKKLTKQDQLIGNFDISPDGKHILFTARTENRRNQSNRAEIFLFSLKDSSTKQLTDNKAPESRLKWAPDGKSFAYVAADDKEWELREGKIWVMNLESGKYEMLSKNYVGSIRSYYWSADSKTIYFQGLQKTTTNLFSLNVSNGALTNISNRDKGTVGLLDLNPKTQQAVLSIHDHRTPADLYVTDLTTYAPKRLTNLNPRIEDSLALANMEVMTWNSKDGLEIEGLLFLPENYDENKKYPFLLHIHGGPAGVFTDAFRYNYPVWAGLGFVQLCPNVRGSSGYGDELLRGNMNDIGGMDYEDLMSGVDALIQKGIIDPDKMAVRGWSYGGILGGTTITKTDRFKAASLGAMVSDWTSEYGIGFNHDVRLWYIGGTPWENPEGYREKSALTHVKNIETPLLLLHGDKDRTDTEPQSMMFFTALKDMGKTVRYIQFPREPHGFREPRHRRTRDIEEIKWVMKYTLDKDWKPWERKDEKEKKKEEKNTPTQETSP